MKPMRMLLGGIAFSAMGLAPAWASCTEGNEQCGASGYVLKCNCGMGVSRNNCSWRSTSLKCGGRSDLRPLSPRQDVASRPGGMVVAKAD